MTIALFRCSVCGHSAAFPSAVFLFLILIWQVSLGVVQAADDPLFVAGVFRSQSKNWDALRQNFKLLRDEHSAYITPFNSVFKQQYFSARATRLQGYQGHINAEVLRRNLPAEIALLPLIESGLNINALSSVKAVGFWQLMEGTAREYGITINHEFDGRKDIVLSTDAALNYIEMLYRSLKDWLLVIAAYNAGEGRVRRALKKVPQGQVVNLWQLDLPVETKNHVAQVLALSRVISSPARFGVSLPSLPGGIVFLFQNHRTTFDRLAIDIGLPGTELRLLNASFTSDWFDPGYQQGIYITENQSIKIKVDRQGWASQNILKPDHLVLWMTGFYRSG